MRRSLKVIRRSAVAVHQAPCRSFFTVVRQGHEGWREFLGWGRAKLRPGLHWDLPFVHRVWTINVMESCRKVTDTTVQTLDRVPATVTFDVFSRITDSEKACYNLDGINDCMDSVARTHMAAVLAQYEWNQIQTARDEINAAVDIRLSNDAYVGTEKRWGILVTRIAIQSIVTTDGFKKQLEERAKAKIDAEILAIDTNAAVDRLQRLTEQLKCSKAATETLVKLKELDNVGEIARGPNKAVYFLPGPGTTTTDAMVVQAKILADSIAQSKA